MNFNEYQKKAHSTAQYPTRISLFGGYKDEIAILNWAYPSLGLSAEVGELENQLKKVIRDDKGIITEMRDVEIRDEIGDVLWYIAELCSTLGYSMDEIANMNIGKLKLRQKNNQIHGDKR